MCLLTFFPPNAAVDLDALTAGAEYNDDGHGFALVYPDTEGIDHLALGHGMHGPTVIDRFNRLRERYPDTPAMFHSRIGTAGKRTTINCHPFFLGDTADTVIAHNGILPTRVQPRKGDTRSDTAILAEDYLPDHPVFSLFDDSRARRQFTKWLNGDKVLILTTNPQYLEQSYLFGEDEGDWVHGVWYSNTSYKPYTSRYGSYTYDYASYSGHSTNVIGGPVASEDEGYQWEKSERGIWNKVPIVKPAVVKSALESADVFEGADSDAVTVSLCEPCGEYGIEVGKQFCENCLSCVKCGMSIYGVDETACTCRPAAELEADYLAVLAVWESGTAKSDESESSVVATTEPPTPTPPALPPGSSVTPTTIPTFSEEPSNA